MMRHVILLADSNEAPAAVLSEVLREAGIMAAVTSYQTGTVASDEPEPVAVLYQLKSRADTVKIHAAIERARRTWPGVPLVACRYSNGSGPFSNHTPDDAALKRLGFRAVADEPAQLPVLLREVEEQGQMSEPHLAEKIESEFSSGSLLLPQRIKTEALRAAFELVASLHFANDQKGAAHTALAGLAALVEADRWAVYLMSEMSGGEAATFEPLAARGLTTREREIPADDWRRALAGDAMMLVGSESAATREAAARIEAVRKTEGRRRALAVPLVSGDRAVGVIEAVREGDDARSFTKSEAELLSALALPISSALSNSLRVAEAERLSQTDDLTKLHNARFLRQFLLSEVKRARRYGSNVAALFLDLDDFKRVNDEHGHLVGSHVLMEMAAVVLSSVRDTDIVARYGGDEFVVVLPESGLDQVVLVAERIREKIARHIFNGGRRLELRLTASFGVAVFPEHAQSPQQLIAAADSSMYDAKAAGKNCVRVAAPPPASLPAGR